MWFCFFSNATYFVWFEVSKPHRRFYFLGLCEVGPGLMWLGWTLSQAASARLSVPVKAGGCALTSAAEGWHAASSAIHSGPGLPATLPVQIGHCFQSSFCFPAKSMIISGFSLFFMSVPLIKYWAYRNGQEKKNQK